MAENLAKAWQSGDQAKVWEMVCGFLDISVEEFMDVQEKLLMEQIELLAQCELGRAIMGDQVPTSVEEFRRIVPLTTYSDYEPYLGEKREDVLPLKPYVWMQTGGTTKRKWIPMTDKATEAMKEAYLALLIISSASERGRFTLRPGDTMLYSVAPPPYMSGIGYREVSKMANWSLLPPAEQAEQMDFQTRIARGLYLGLAEGLDIVLALPGILVKIGESFVHMLKSMPAVADPRAAARLEQAARKAEAEGRSILPWDVWEVKSLTAFGADLAAFEDKIEFYWGRKPRNFYPNTEFIVPVAFCSWKGEGMTPVPHGSFYEFIREKDCIRSQQDPSYRPPTLLLNELEENERYELLFTNFHGGALVRYRVGDFIKVISLENEEAGICLPQIIPDGRTDRLIDIAGFTRLSERVIWQVLENLGIRYEGWMIRKELEDKEPVLRLYLATDETDLDRLQEEIHQSLKKFDSDYADLESMSGLKPLRLKPLPYGVFERYTELRRAAGSDPGQLKARCMAPSDEVVETILKLAEN